MMGGQGSSINELETAGLPSGLYFWRIESAGEVLQQGKYLKMWRLHSSYEYTRRTSIPTLL